MNLVASHLLGRFVGLEPLEERHRQQMAKASIDPRIWRNTPLGGSFDRYFDSLRQLRDTGRQMPFAVRWLETSEIIGGTRFLDIVPEQYRLEIGGTWYHPDYWGGRANAESKLLLMTQAFGAAAALRVQFLTDVLNTHSQAAIAKLGAQREGVVRNHMVVDGGRQRDSVMYSIIRDEWPSVRTRLELRLK